MVIVIITLTYLEIRSWKPRDDESHGKGSLRLLISPE